MNFKYDIEHQCFKECNIEKDGKKYTSFDRFKFSVRRIKSRRASKRYYLRQYDGFFGNLITFSDYYSMHPFDRYSNVTLEEAMNMFLEKWYSNK